MGISVFVTKSSNFPFSSGSSTTRFTLGIDFKALYSEIVTPLAWVTLHTATNWNIMLISREKKERSSLFSQIAVSFVNINLLFFGMVKIHTPTLGISSSKLGKMPEHCLFILRSKNCCAEFRNYKGVWELQRLSYLLFSLMLKVSDGLASCFKSSPSLPTIMDTDILCSLYKLTNSEELSEFPTTTFFPFAWANQG